PLEGGLPGQARRPGPNGSAGPYGGGGAQAAPGTGGNSAGAHPYPPHTHPGGQGGQALGTDQDKPGSDLFAAGPGRPGLPGQRSAP
ncbi:hypothetical protein L1885_28700, partial [Streptomyces fuscigenes]|nr:hypothetical protein [Streptomyces fuscigenes]